MNKIKKLILIDGNALMHRAYHALPPLTTKKGEVVNAVYGFTSVLLKVIKELKPDYMICAFDVAGGTFRDKIYSEYKAGRKKPDQEFYDQIPKIKEVVGVLNIPIIEKKGFEADDIIGTLSKQANYELRITIVTGDLDALQLVDKNTKVYTLRKGIKDTVIYDEEAVKKRYGLSPEQIIDFKGLRGDPSDNIPGVKGIGEKGASELLKNFGSIEKLYKAIEEGKTEEMIKPKIKEKLIAQKEEALMSKELATIKCDMNIKLDLDDCIWGNYDKGKLNSLFKELEFYSLINRVNEANNMNKELETVDQENKKRAKHIILDTDEKFNKFLKELKKQKIFAFQTRSSDDDAKQRDLTGMVFMWKTSPIYYMSLVLNDNKPNLFNTSECRTNEAMSRLYKIIKPILEDENYKKIGYFFKRDIEVLCNHGIDINGLDFDIMLASYLLDPGKRDYSLDKIIFDYLGHMNSVELKNEKLQIGSTQENGANNEKELQIGSTQENGANNEKELQTEDTKKDNNTTTQQHNNIIYFFELYRILKEKLKKEEMNNLFYKMEMPLIKVLVKMEMNGVILDTQLLKVLSGDLSNKIFKLEEKIHTLSGDNNFNIKSSQQLSQVLFGKMKLPTNNIKKTQSGYSTAAPELEKLKESHIIVSFISEYKEFVKLKNTYVDALPKLISKKTTKLHTTFNQTVTATGRLSSSKPNLQNIPIRTEVGRKIRKAFIAKVSKKLVSADYSQIELRVIAMVADDKKMKEIFNKGLDIHVATAAEVNQVPVEEVTSQMRRSAKALNFGVIYGMGIYGFARSAGIERDKAKEFIENYMKKFSGVAQYIEKSKEDARKIGYAETIWGRRRYLPELNSSNAMVKNMAERMAINMPIQGTAADIMKIAMLKVDKWVDEYNNKNENAIEILLQVHDELLFSIKEDNISEATKEIKEIMENCHLNLDGKEIDFSVPIVVDLKMGDNWEEMTNILTY
ncbi:MAG: DNA polymerase I [Patescibacteria group bacterium]|nr:DNA polymerase I [Patescibacteria group bacterium]